MSNEKIAKHLLLSQWIKDNISNQTFLVGDKIPSENELSNLFGYSRQTVRQAIGNLVSEGILTREHGSGTYVNLKPLLKPNPSKTMRVGVITTYLDDYIFPSIIHGIEEVLTVNGYTMSLGITHNKPSNEENCLHSMIQTGVDGIIIEGTKTALPNMNESLYEELKERNIPTVFINGFNGSNVKSYVVMDDRKAGELALDYLNANGHTHIGGIFKSDDIQGIKRYEGLLKSLKKNNHTLHDNSMIWYTTEDFKYFFDGSMDKIIMERLKDVTAVVCYNDQVAAGLIKVLKRNHLSVPDDKSIISFDNSFLAKEMVCNLTSVIHPSKKIGKKAALILQKRMEDYSYEEEVILEPSLKIRESVKVINKL